MSIWSGGRSAVPEAYVVHIQPSAQRDLDRIDPHTRQRILDRLSRLEGNPRHPGTQKLKGYELQWRLRVGDYRILYEIHDREREVRIYRIAHRREAYR